jgi:cholesterol oxidase
MISTVEHFDAVVIGTGFGGSVMTYRLAEAGMRVCTLERGQEYPPNSFPRAPYDLAKNFWDPSKRLFGLFNLWSFKGSGALVSSGLGGGSLIYANVLIRKDPKWFKDELPNGGYRLWPLQYADLERHYAEAEKMLNVQQYPLLHEPYKGTPKTLAMKEASEFLTDGDLKGKWMPLPLGISFRREKVDFWTDDLATNPPVVGAEIPETDPNYHTAKHGRPMPRSTCRLCGECDMGCNYGSKNTLDYTYLSAAIHQTIPADIRTLCEVKSISPLGITEKGYKVEYVIHDPAATVDTSESGPEPERRTLTCNYLVLSAGTFGTPYLLMKNQGSFPGISGRLGQRFSVNGDLLSFISKSIEKKNGKSAPRRLDPSFGPVITSTIRFDDDLDGIGAPGRGFYVQDGGQPYLMSWLAEVSGLPGLLGRSISFLKMMLKYRLGLSHDADLGAEISDLIGDAESSMTTMPILSMGRDVPSGRLFLTEGMLDCDWKIDESEKYFDRVRRAGKAIAKGLNAEYLDNPSYKFNFHQVLTAHPLGGCSMAENEGKGVVDSNCEVFGYRGMYIADGSVMPGPVGPNPSLTIAAIAGHCANHLIQQFKRDKSGGR